MKQSWCTIYCWCILSILFITSTCFRPLQVHHQGEQLYLCDTWHLLFCMDDCPVCTVFIPPCIPTSHPHRTTSTKCHINTVVSPDDGHTVAQNKYRKETNILIKIVHQVGFIYKIVREFSYVHFPSYLQNS